MLDWWYTLLGKSVFPTAVVTLLQAYPDGRSIVFVDDSFRLIYVLRLQVAEVKTKIDVSTLKYLPG